MGVDLRRDLARYDNCHYVDVTYTTGVGDTREERRKTGSPKTNSPEETQHLDAGQRRRSFSENLKRARDIEGTPGELMAQDFQEKRVFQEGKWQPP